MPRRRRPRVIVCGILFNVPVAGAAYQVLHYLLDLEALGYDTSHVDDTDWCHSPAARTWMWSSWAVGATIAFALGAGLVDTLTLHLAPVVLGTGTPQLAGAAPRSLVQGPAESRSTATDLTSDIV